MTPRILLLAGEASGDKHGAGVVRALKDRYPDGEFVGLGGPLMEAQGVELMVGLEHLAVMGFVEVASRLPFFWKLQRRINRLLDGGTIDLVIPIDYPGFNLRVARAAHRRGIRVLYYIAPQVWAWKPARTARIAENVDRLAVILPFEKDIFEEAGTAVTFVGHPLLDLAESETTTTEGEFRQRWGLHAQGPILALMPGSRRQEIDRHLDIFVRAAALAREQHPDLQPVLARASPVPRTALESTGLPVVEDARSLLAFSRAALVKSGTGTLEAALEGTPFITVYRTHPLTYALARRLMNTDHIGLANLVAGEAVVPEVIQQDATPERLAELLAPLLVEGSRERTEMIAGLERVRGSLGSAGASERVAALAAELLGGG